MDSMIILEFFLALMSTVVQPGAGEKYDFEAIFNFGDSNSDTGGYFAAFPSQGPPNGITYFKGPTGRPSDGRMYLDFMATALGLPFVSPYLQSIGSDFRHGANFATSLSTALQPSAFLLELGMSPFSLAIQLNQMKHFKSIIDEKSPGYKELPSPDIFGKALFTISIGQNDFAISLMFDGINDTMKKVPQIVSQISSTIKELYGLGGRTFIVLNLSPIGCYPLYIARLTHGASDIDEYGCVINYKHAVDEFNNMLKESLNQMRQHLGDANVIYVNTHDVLTELFQHPKSHGLQEGTKACCGAGGGHFEANGSFMMKRVRFKRMIRSSCRLEPCSTRHEIGQGNNRWKRLLIPRRLRSKRRNPPEEKICLSHFVSFCPSHFFFCPSCFSFCLTHFLFSV